MCHLPQKLMDKSNILTKILSTVNADHFFPCQFTQHGIKQNTSIVIFPFMPESIITNSLLALTIAIML